MWVLESDAQDLATLPGKLLSSVVGSIEGEVGWVMIGGLSGVVHFDIYGWCYPLSMAYATQFASSVAEFEARYRPRSNKTHACTRIPKTVRELVYRNWMLSRTSAPKSTWVLESDARDDTTLPWKLLLQWWERDLARGWAGGCLRVVHFQVFRLVSVVPISPYFWPRRLNLLLPIVVASRNTGLDQTRPTVVLESRFNYQYSMLSRTSAL